MRLTTLVPALACVAAVPFASAADTKLEFDGFVDSVLSTSSVVDSDPEFSESNTAFSYAAKLGIKATITEKIGAQLDIVAPGDGTLGINQAYGTWAPIEGLELKSGKFIGDIGWVAAYAPDLYRINAGPIVGLYGSNPTGVRLGYAKDALSIGLTVSNGIFTEADSTGQTDAGQPNEHFGYTLDIAFNLPDDKGSINAEAAYDMSAAGKEGDALHLALNATITPVEALTLGAELIYQRVAAPDGSTDEDSTHLGALLMANYKLGKALPFDSSVTAMWQYVQASDYGLLDPFGLGVSGIDVWIHEFSLALLTYPGGSDKLGLNFEVNYTMRTVEPAGGGPEMYADSIGGAVELLYVF